MIELFLWIGGLTFFILYMEERNNHNKKKRQIDEMSRQLAELSQRLNIVPEQSEQKEHSSIPVQAMPQEVPQQPVSEIQTPRPQALPSPVEKKKSALNILLWLGVLFITVAGFVFGTTQWHILGDVIKVGVIMGTVLLFFALAAVSEKILKIRQTGKAFYVLGCIFLPLSLIASAFFGLFGEWFHYSGGGAWMFWAACSILLGIALGIGVKIYRQSWIYFAMLVCITATLSCIIHGNIDRTEIIQICYGAYFCILALLNTRIAIKEPYKKCTDIFVRIHFFTVGIWIFILSGGDSLWELTGLSLVLASLVWLYKETGKKVYHICFAVYYTWIFALIRSTFSFEIASGIIGICVLLSFFKFELLTKKKWFPARIAVADIMLLLATAAVVGEFYWKRIWGYNGVGIGNIVCVITAIVMVCYIILEKEASSWTKVLRFGVPIQICILTDSVLYRLTERITTIWLQGIAVITVAIILLVVQQKWKRLAVLETPFFLFSLIVTAWMSIMAKNRQNIAHVETFQLCSFVLLALYLVLRSIYDGRKGEATKTKVMTYFALTSMAVCAFQLLPAICEWGLLVEKYDRVYSFVPVGIFSIIAFLAGAFLKKQNWKFFSQIALGGTSCVMACLCLMRQTLNGGYAQIACGYLLVAIAITLYEKISVLAIPMVMMSIPVVNNLLKSRMEVTAQMLFLEVIALFLLGRMIFPEFFLKDSSGKNKYKNIDVFAIGAIVAILMQFLMGTRESATIAFITLALFCLNFFKRGFSGKVEKIAITLAGVCLVIAWWNQPWIVISQVAKMEFIVVPAIAFSFLLRFIVWKEYGARMGKFAYAVTAVSAGILMLDAMQHEWLFDVLFMGISAFAMLMLSFHFKKKKWFVLASVILLILAVYMTRYFWLSIAWWIYLLTVGITLIFIAAQNERLKQKGTSVKKKISRLWEDWTW